ncbi:DUF4129 domain-containing protein [Gaetbulibacter aestuarii]|uniref:DUF4129 domain-containing protein n=1 Tax=Gaetbulibacter aestuarii TaxID=1502358 RepID=A0ABW7MXX0_9FLAO
MSKKFLIYSIFLIFSWWGFSQEYQLPKLDIPTTFQPNTDTLKIDRSSVTPRKFDDFYEKYKGDDFRYESETAQGSGWWSRFKAWIKQLIKSIFNLEGQDQILKAQNLIKQIGGITIFLLVVFFIFKAVMNKEGRWIFGKSSDKNIIPVRNIEADIHSTDFKALIASAEAENNYRLAIRYYYLWLLKGLSENGIIHYDVEKTNSDYQNEISSDSLKKSFSYSSYLYNYIWYGEFPVNQIEFDHAKTTFSNLLNQLKA